MLGEPSARPPQLEGKRTQHTCTVGVDGEKDGLWWEGGLVKSTLFSILDRPKLWPLGARVDGEGGLFWFASSADATLVALPIAQGP